MSDLNPYSIVPFVSGIATSSLGLYCFLKNHSARVHQLFCLLCFSVVPWLVALSVFLNLSAARDVIWWTKMGHVTCTLAPAFLFDLAVTLTGFQRFRVLVRCWYAYAAIVILAMWTTNYYFPPLEIYRYAWGPYARSGLLTTVDALMACVAAGVSLSLLARAVNDARRRGLVVQANRLKYFGLSFGIFVCALSDYLPKYGIPFLPIGSFFILAFACLATYAIIKHQILDFTIAIRGTAVYSILAACITASYLVAVLIMEKWFQGFLGYRSLIATSIVGFMIALGFIPLKNRVQQFVDRHFFRGSQEELVLENEQLRREVQQTEKLKVISTLAAGMAHEIKNPLASIKTFAEYLPQKYDDPEFRSKFAKIMNQEVDKMNTLVQRLLNFARPAPPQLQTVLLSRVIHETVEFLQGTLLEKHIQVETTLAQADTVWADPAQLKQVFLNVLLNSIEAMEQPGHITITTWQRNGHLEVSVADTGPGIPQKHLQRAFDPFYTTKPGGTGLGLSVVHSIVREHGGRISLHSKPGKGTTVWMRLPVFNGGTNGAHADSHCG